MSGPKETTGAVEVGRWCKSLQNGSKNKQQPKSNRSNAAGADDNAKADTSQTDRGLKSHFGNAFLSILDTQRVIASQPDRTIYVTQMSYPCEALRV